MVLCYALLLILIEFVFLAEGSFFVFGEVGEERLPAGTEIDVPTPKSTKKRIGVLVVVSSKFAIFTRLCHDYM